MIYAYIFVMAGVTYLIRIFILYSICLSDCHDISGNSLCHAVPCLRYGGTCDRSTPCPQEEKPDRCGRVCLRGSFSGRTAAGNVVK